MEPLEQQGARPGIITQGKQGSPAREPAWAGLGPATPRAARPGSRPGPARGPATPQSRPAWAGQGAGHPPAAPGLQPGLGRPAFGDAF